MIVSQNFTLAFGERSRGIDFKDGSNEWQARPTFLQAREGQGEGVVCQKIKLLYISKASRTVCLEALSF